MVKPVVVYKGNGREALLREVEREARSRKDLLLLWDWKEIFKEDPLEVLGRKLTWDDVYVERWGIEVEEGIGTLREGLSEEEWSLVRRHFLLGLEANVVRLAEESVRKEPWELMRDRRALIYLPFPAVVEGILPLKGRGREAVSYPTEVIAISNTGITKHTTYPCREGTGLNKPRCIVEKILWEFDLLQALWNNLRRSVDGFTHIVAFNPSREMEELLSKIEDIAEGATVWIYKGEEGVER